MTTWLTEHDLKRDRFDFYVTVLGLQIHKQRHWGGWIT